MGEPSDSFWQHYGDAIEACSDMRAARNLRRRIRRDRSLAEDERAELLARARYIPGCKPLPVHLDDEGSVRRTTYADRRLDPWESETEDGGLERITPEEHEASKRRPGAILPTGQR